MTPWRAHVTTIRGKGRPRFAGGRAFTDPATRAAEAEIARLRAMGVYGAIVGKALYAGRLDLKRALHVARGEENPC